MPKRVFTQTFGVVGAIIEKEGKVLLVKEHLPGQFDDKKWSHPAGWIEVGEDPLKAVAREVEEETGFAFTPTALLGVYSLVRKENEKGAGTYPHAVKLTFLGEIADEQKELLSDTSEARWFSPEEIYGMNGQTLRDVDIKQMVKDYFAGKQYPLEVIRHSVVENRK